MKYAYIDNGIVREAVQNNPFALFSTVYAEKFIECPDEVAGGWLYDGATFAAPTAPPPAIPQTVSMRQARLALLGAGMLDAVNAAITSAGGAAQIEWEYASEVVRSSDLVAGMGAALALPDAQIDALFVSAATL